MRNLGSKLGRLPARLRLCRRELCGALLCGTELGASLCFGLKVSCFGLGGRFGRLMAQSGRLPPRLLELLRPSAALIGTHRHSSAIRAIHGGPWAIQGIRRPPWPSMAIDGIRRHTWRSGVISRHSPTRYARGHQGGHQGGHQASSAATHLRDTLEHLLHLRRLGRRLGRLGRLRLRSLGRGGDEGARLGAHTTRLALEVLEALLMSTQSGLIIRGNPEQSSAPQLIT